MTALAKERMQLAENWKYRQFTLTGAKGWKGGAAAISTVGATAGKVVPASALPGLIVIGKFAETIDATAADKLVNVELSLEIVIEWWVNGTAGDAVAATDVGKIAYIKDDNTVSILPNGSSPMGRIWAFDATKGVAIERLQAAPGGGTLGVLTSPAAFTANDMVMPNNPASGSVIDIPTTAAASTVTLPATTRDGTVLYFFADGTKNGHTVQYRDATGPVNLTTALTASKRHLVVAVSLGGKWAANAYIAP